MTVQSASVAGLSEELKQWMRTREGERLEFKEAQVWGAMGGQTKDHDMTQLESSIRYDRAIFARHNSLYRRARWILLTRTRAIGAV